MKEISATLVMPSKGTCDGSKGAWGRQRVPAANHASFGDYGGQRGDGQVTASDAHVRDIITTQMKLLLADGDQKTRTPANR